MTGDEVLCSAHSSELVKYGVGAGLKNYPAAYCTGLLCARRLLTNMKFTNEEGEEQTLSELYDGGLDIPHSNKRFPGYSPEKKKYNANAHLDRIYGVHVANYMRKLQKDDAAKYAEHFSRFIKAGKGPDSIKQMYEDAHAAILRDASRGEVPAEQKHAYLKDAHPLQVKLSKAQRVQRVANKKVYKAWKEWKDDQDEGGANDEAEADEEGSGSSSSSDEEE